MAYYNGDVGLMVARHPADEVGDVDVGSIFSKIASAAKSIGHAAAGAVHAVGTAARGVSSGVAWVGKQAGHIPIIGAGVKGAFDLTIGAPFAVADKVLSGQRLDKVALSTLKEKVGSIRAVAPYAQTVVSFVPGIGQGIAGAIGASMALASGMPISKALVEGVKGALPGGALARAAFDVGQAAIQGRPLDQVALAALPLSAQQKQIVLAGLNTAKALAHGQRVDQALLNNALSALPADAQKAIQIGMAVGHGQVLQAVKTASSMAKTAPLARDVFGRVGNVLPGPLKRALPTVLHPEISRVMSAVRSNPVLMSAPAAMIARQTGVSTAMAARALASGRFGLGWRPLSPAATAFTRVHSPFSSLRALSDTRGLSPDGLVYVVEKGDYPAKIAKLLSGSDKNWPALIAANKQKKTVNRGIGPEFATLVAGEKLFVPASWKKPVSVQTPGAAPAPNTPAVVVVDPQRANTASILQAKALLVSWTKSDGAKEAGFPDYGMSAEDLGATFGERDRFILASFEDWSNRVRGTNLPKDGLLTDTSLQALRDWAEKKVSLPIPPLAPAQEPASSPLPGIVPTMQPAPQQPSANSAPTPPVPIDLPTMTIEEQAPAKPKSEGGLALALVGAGLGAAAFGITGAAIGGAGGFLLDSLGRATAT